MKVISLILSFHVISWHRHEPSVQHTLPGVVDLTKSTAPVLETSESEAIPMIMKKNDPLYPLGSVVLQIQHAFVPVAP